MKDGRLLEETSKSAIDTTELETIQVPLETSKKDFFDTTHLSGDLKERSVRGGAVTMAGQGAKFLLRMSSTVILARLLTPEDYGLIAMVAVLTNFVMMFKDIGLSTATIQRAEINQKQISTLFWINVVVSLVIMLVMTAMAPVISWFYGRPRLTLVTIALSGTFIFSGLTIQHQALLRRQMHFGKLAVIDISAMLVSVIVAVVSAWYGAGYWALVIMQLVSAISIAVGVWIACDWRPGLPRRGAGVGSMLAFGGNITSFNFINYFARNADNILLGRFWGAGVLGLYNRAYSIMMLPISQIRGPLTSVAIPALSHIQNDPVRYKKYYVKLVTLLAFITMPLMAFLFVCSDEVVNLLLGGKWSGVIVIFKILCIVAFIQPVSTTWGLVLVSLGQTRRYLILGAMNSVGIVMSFVFGLPWGAIGVAIAYAVANYVFLIPTLWYSFRSSPISMKDFFTAITRPLAASLFIGAAVFCGRWFLANWPDAAVVGACLGIGLLAYIIALILIPGGCMALREFFSYASVLFGRETS